MVLSILVIIACITTIIIILKNNNNNNNNDTIIPNENKPSENTPVDVSNITDNTVIEGASRDMDVISDEDAVKILSEMYIKAMDTYGFNFDTEENEDSTKIKLVGYKELLNNFFTSNGINQFEEFYKNKLEKDGESVYISEVSLIKEELNYSFDIIEKDITKDKIVSKFRTTYNDIQKDDAVFTIIKADNIWKIDNFVCPF